jgi:hypothetical protein
VKRNVYKILVRKPDGIDHLEDLYVGGNIKMEHKEVGQEGIDWIHLAQDRNKWRALVNTVMDLRVS